MFGNFIENLMNKFHAKIVTTRKAILKEVIQTNLWKLLNKYSNESEMCLTDTDNLKQKTEAENVYEYFYKDKGLFEFSNYPKY